jgi:hypothetical protein
MEFHHAIYRVNSRVACWAVDWREIGYGQDVIPGYAPGMPGGGRCGLNAASNKLKAKSFADSAMRKLTNLVVKSPCAVAQKGFLVNLVRQQQGASCVAGMP